jgi:REP element-mobilizing transposase RayT
MTDRFKNIYRISSARWQKWDYSANAAYFITVCTVHRERFFGEINNGEMKLSEIGKTVQSEWLKTFELRLDMNLIPDEYVIMPNHFHGIVVFGENQYNTDKTGNGGGDVQTQCAVHVQWQSNKFGSQSKNLASVIRGFKSAVKKFATMNNIPFAWQTRFHDRVIRNYSEYNRIVHYINTNIENWHHDELYM